MEGKHTPEPWHTTVDRLVTVEPYDTCEEDALTQTEVRDELPLLDASDKAVAYIVGRADDTHEANAERIVACVNGCEGLNPDAVRDMYEALLSIAEDQALVTGDEDAGQLRQYLTDIIETAYAALAKAEGR